MTCFCENNCKNHNSNCGCNKSCGCAKLTPYKVLVLIDPEQEGFQECGFEYVHIQNIEDINLKSLSGYTEPSVSIENGIISITHIDGSITTTQIT